MKHLCVHVFEGILLKMKWCIHGTLHNAMADLISFESDASPASPYFNLEDELVETKKKLHRLEEKYKKHKDKMKQQCKRMEDRLKQLEDENVEKEKRLEDRLKRIEDQYTSLVKNAVTIVPCVLNGQLQLYDLHCSEIKISVTTVGSTGSRVKAQQLSMDGTVLCNDVYSQVVLNLNFIPFLKQCRHLKSLKIEILESCYQDGMASLIVSVVNVCDALLYSNKGLNVLFKYRHHRREQDIQQMIQLFKKFTSYSTFTLEGPYPECYKREIDEMRAHCTEHGIAFTYTPITA